MVMYRGTAADIDDEDDGDRARGESEHVWRLAGVVESLLAGAEGEEWTEATGRRSALARSGRDHAHHCMSWADLGTSCAGQCQALLGRWLVPACSGE
jgi:hypothetical protein